MFRGLFSSIDLFGVPVVINYAGKEKLKTRFGGVLSVLFFFLVVATLYNASHQMFRKENPNTISSDTYSENPRQMLLTPDSFPVAIGIQAPEELLYTSYVNEQIFKLNITLNTITTTIKPDGTRQRTPRYKNLNVDRCKAANFGRLASIFLNLELNNMLCIAIDQTDLDVLALEGAFVSSVYQTLTIDVYECDPATSTCASEAVRTKFLEGAWFNLIYANMVLDPSNYANPDARFQDFYSKTLTRATHKISTVFLEHVDVQTDSGWLFEEMSNKSYVKVSNFQENSQAKESEDRSVSLISCTLEVSKLETHVTRSYKKVQTVLAEVAGLANTIMVTILIGTSPYLKLRFRETLMKTLYDVEVKPNRSHKDQQQPKQTTNSNRKKKNKKKTSNAPVDIPSPAINNQDPDIGRERDSSVHSFNIAKAKTGLPHDNYGDRGITTNSNALGSRDEPKPARKDSSETAKGKPSQSKAFSWREQEIKQQKEGFDNNNYMSLASLKNEKVEGDKIKPHEFLTKESPIKVSREPSHDVEKENPNHSVLYPELIDTLRDPKVTYPREDEEDGPLSAIEDNLEDHNEHGAINIENFDKLENESDTVKENRPSNIASTPKNTRYTYEGALSVWEYILAFIYQPKKLKKKVKVLLNGAKTIDQRLDVVNILKKMREIDKMRAILFDHDQLLLFNNLPKPEINPKREKEVPKGMGFSHMILKKPYQMDKVGTEKEILESYQRLKSKEPKTKIDRKLLEIFDEVGLDTGSL